VSRRGLFAALLLGLGACASGGNSGKAGQSFRDCEDCPEMVAVPAGSYMMGSPPEEASRYENEGPQHRVTISEPFAAGRYEVTVGEWSRFVDETGYSVGNSCWTLEEVERKNWRNRKERSWQSPGFDQTESHPVACVNWDDARAYTEWLSGKTGKRYRLLSESEWEYAARAGTTTARYWGESASAQCRHANAGDAAVNRVFDGWTGAECDDGFVHTAPVGSFEPNGFGLHDMLGNVWEWVEDCWNDSYEGAPTDGSAWTTKDCDPHVRVVRGDAWFNKPKSLRAAIRISNSAGFRTSFNGFRIARTLSP